jgi:hypothetical protein
MEIRKRKRGRDGGKEVSWRQRDKRKNEKNIKYFLFNGRDSDGQTTPKSNLQRSPYGEDGRGVEQGHLA